jgi:CheY-like chemotaxis protein
LLVGALKVSNNTLLLLCYAISLYHHQADGDSRPPQKMGIHVAEAVDGEDGISEYTLFKPGLGESLSSVLCCQHASNVAEFTVLLDINMPRKNGFEAAIAIRLYEAEMKWPRCKIIAVTALQGPLNEHRGLIE